MKNLHTDPRENAPVKHTVTPDDLQQMQRRRIEAHAARETSPDISQERSAEQPEGALLLVFKTVLTGFRRCQSVALEKCSSDA